MSKIRIILAVILLFALFYPVLAEDLIPDDIQATISSPVLVANGFDNTSIRITVFNQSNPLSNCRVDFLVNESSIGSLSPNTTITSPSGIAETTFSVTENPGEAEITARVFYTINGSQYSRNFLIEPKITILNPIPIRSILRQQRNG